MQRGLVIGGLGIVAVGLAFFLFQAPDTGGEVAPATPRASTVVAPPPTEAPPTPPAPGVVTPPPTQADGRIALPSLPATTPQDIVPPEGTEVKRKGPNPVNAKIDARRDMPDAIYAGRFATQWTQMLRELNDSGSPAAAPLAERASGLITKFRDFRRMPLGYEGYDGLVAEQRALINDMRSAPLGTAGTSKVLDALTRMEGELAVAMATTPIPSNLQE